MAEALPEVMLIVGGVGMVAFCDGVPEFDDDTIWEARDGEIRKVDVLESGGV